ncbi:MAG TPA: hypothetical protein VFE53_09520 [Mucilaginibacter sp.]|jgi:Skp family chaperone for outer membrane proteins|nr:hypothetical protein [Mucilaginibacter sp.]
MPRLIIYTLLICFGFSTSFAQDTAKKQPAVKTIPKSPPRHHYYTHYKTKADSLGDSGSRRARFATDSVLPVLTNQSLNSQYQYLIDRVYHYQQPLISALWKNASDTLSANRAKLNTALAKLNSQNKLADSLKTALNDQNQELAHKDGVEFFGLALSQTTYNLFVWGLVALFAIIAIAVISRSGAYRREARYRTQLFAELEEEFKTYKAKANDKEKKLARELQTERNKLDDLLGRG